MNRFLVVFDTNVLVSALLSNSDSNETKLMEYTEQSVITPIFSDEIIEEYKEVLSRKEFGFSKKNVGEIISKFRKRGLLIKPKELDLEFKDISDLKFYEVVMDKKDKNARLVTGNIKHFPKNNIVVTPKELIRLIEN